MAAVEEVVLYLANDGAGAHIAADFDEDDDVVCPSPAPPTTARASRDAYFALPQADQDRVIEFLKALQVLPNQGAGHAGGAAPQARAR